MNPRPLGPEPSALPTALHPVKKNRSSWAAAVWLGMRGSNSHGRSQSPLHYHYANPHRICVLGVCPQRSYIIACPVGFVNAFFKKTFTFFVLFRFRRCFAFFHGNTIRWELCGVASDKSVKSYLVRGGILGYAGSRERDENSKGACCNEI